MDRFAIFGFLICAVSTLSALAADRLPPSRILFVNGQIRMHEQAAIMLANQIENHVSLKRTGDNIEIRAEESSLWQSILELYNKDENSGWRFSTCNTRSAKQASGLFVDESGAIVEFLLCRIKQ